MNSYQIVSQKDKPPWTVGDGGWVAECAKSQHPTQGCEPGPALAAPAGPLMLHMVMSAEGASAKLKVLYAPDYTSGEQRVLAASRLYVQLSQVMPGY